MSRYYLHLRDFKGALVVDEDGSDVASLAIAKEHAMLAMHELIGEAIKRGDQLEIEAIIVADEHGISRPCCASRGHCELIETP